MREGGGCCRIAWWWSEIVPFHHPFTILHEFVQGWGPGGGALAGYCSERQQLICSHNTSVGNIHISWEKKRCTYDDKYVWRGRMSDANPKEWTDDDERVAAIGES